MAASHTLRETNYNSIKSIVAHQIGLSSADECHIADPEQWMCGSFVICIPVNTDSQGLKPEIQTIIRFPLPYRVGEVSCPGIADEKILCEAWAYVWLQANCPDVVVPHLYEFGLATGQTVRYHVIFRSSRQSSYAYTLDGKCPPVGFGVSRLRSPFSYIEQSRAECFLNRGKKTVTMLSYE
ncbi:uncharacterized protein N7529_005021 [Penicillium soppii]|uniref:uncharacterized protein n=1 Tax=Penicillium soppii TaxID=69789 RepID=UPI002547501D|nr:uncharacterized protein N7529_005021 [Penicillium soppii]KAJ5872668.1 hypothetical protein N7529_005021 [Penicillium soppii]